MGLLVLGVQEGALERESAGPLAISEVFTVTSVGLAPATPLSGTRLTSMYCITEGHAVGEGGRGTHHTGKATPRGAGGAAPCIPRDVGLSMSLCGAPVTKTALGVWFGAGVEVDAQLKQRLLEEPLLGGRVHPGLDRVWYLHPAREYGLQKSFVSLLLKGQICRRGRLEN